MEIQDAVTVSHDYKNPNHDFGREGGGGGGGSKHCNENNPQNFRQSAAISITCSITLFIIVINNGAILVLISLEQFHQFLDGFLGRKYFRKIFGILLWDAPLHSRVARTRAVSQNSGAWSLCLQYAHEGTPRRLGDAVEGETRHKDAAEEGSHVHHKMLAIGECRDEPSRQSDHGCQVYAEVVLDFLRVVQR